MLLAIAVVVVTTALGTALALVPPAGARSVRPIRILALVAVVAVVVTHLLPEALEDLGLWALLALLAGAALPRALQWLVTSLLPHGSRDGHAHEGDEAIVLEVSFVGLLAHSVGDGLSMGAIAQPGGAAHEHGDVLLVLGAHTVPVTTAFVMAFGRVKGRRAAVLRAGWLAVAAVVGIVVASRITVGMAHEAGAWIAAIVSGLLIHIVVHDLHDAPPGQS